MCNGRVPHSLTDKDEAFKPHLYLHILLYTNKKAVMAMIIKKRMEIKEEDILKLSQETKTHPIWSSILLQRGLDTVEKVKDFFGAGSIFIEDFPNVSETTKNIRKFVKEGKRFLVYGDYDADGVTSTSIIVKTLQMIGADVSFFIPSRFIDGYGLSMDVLEEKKDSFDVILTVDTGITAVDQVKYLKNLGKYVIITDHHVFSSELPPADHIIHPFLLDKNLKVCGAFVALQLANEIFGGKVPFYLIFLAALGTVADQMPLIGPNRSLVKYVMLESVRNKPFPLPIIFSEIKIDSIYDWQFKIIPMINSAGRINSANYAVYLLLSTSYDEAYHYYNLLKETNEERKSISNEVKEKADEYIKNNGLENHPIMVVALTDSHEGVNGNVASSLLQKYGKPIIIMYKTENDMWVGSGRSRTINLHDSLSSLSHFFDRFGGHDFAVGLRMHDSNLTPFIQSILQHITDNEDPSVLYDVSTHIEKVTPKVVSTMEKMAPFGQGNPEVVFRSHITVSEVTPLKEGKFFKIKDMRNPNVSFLFWEPYTKQVKRGDSLDVLYKISTNDYRGVVSVSATVVYFTKEDGGTDE